MTDLGRPAHETRVLLLAPTAKDAEVACGLLEVAGLDCRACRDLGEVCREVHEGAGAVVVPEEAVQGRRGAPLAEALRGQPTWSSLPVLVLTPAGDGRAPTERALHELGDVTLLARPLEVAAFVSAVQAAVRDRVRQYQVGDHLAERQRLVKELQEADRKKDDFLALLAHELRNPLAPLRNGLQVMALAPDDAEAVADARRMMERQLAHMVHLIDDLLDVSRISRNKMELRRRRLTLAEVVASAVETARPALDAAGHRLVVSLPAEPVILDADLTRLAQVFSNLLSNSAKYTRPGGQVWLTAERRPGRVAVAVRDTGIGIPADSLRSIFDMFSQVDRSMERSTGGLGIGLALVKGLVEMHGGKVEAESAGDGRGSTFTVTLPTLEGGPEALADDAPVLARGGAPRRVLVVDDNRDSATSLAMMLRLLGDDVCLAHDGVEAVEAAEQFRPEVILMDVGMPRLNGLDATRRIRERPWGRGMTVIALTGWGHDDDRARSSEAGCDGHLVKPVRLYDLQQLLARVGRNGH